MTRPAVHEVRVPPQTPAGIQVPREPCGLDASHPPHFHNPFSRFAGLHGPEGARCYCEGAL